MRTGRCLIVVCLLGGMTAVRLRAEYDFRDTRGTATDSSGAQLEGATATVINNSDSLRYPRHG